MTVENSESELSDRLDFSAGEPVQSIVIGGNVLAVIMTGMGADGASGGAREFIPPLVLAAVAAGAHGLFLETHPDPAKALSDGPNAWPLPKMKQLLRTLKALDQLVKQHGLAEQSLIEQLKHGNPV